MLKRDQAAAGAAERDGFQFSPESAVAHLCAADPRLRRLIDTVGPFEMELRRTSSLFTALAEAIVYQQLTGRAAATIYGRVCALFGAARGGPTAAQILAARDDDLRQAGLSRAKVAALRDLAHKSDAREIPTLKQARAMSDSELVERLTVVRGVGRWTVEMLLMFRLGRPDVLPVGDYGIRKGFAIVFNLDELPSPLDLERRAARWKPYRSVASWYLWRAVERAAKKDEVKKSRQRRPIRTSNRTMRTTKPKPPLG